MFRAALLETVVFYEAMTWGQLLKAGGKLVLAAFIAFGGLLPRTPFDPPEPPRATVSAKAPRPELRAFKVHSLGDLHDHVMRVLTVTVDTSDTQVNRRYTAPSRLPYERGLAMERSPTRFKATIVFEC